MREQQGKVEELAGGLANYLESFKGAHVLVIGDTVLDRYVDGTTTRLCREAPVPIVQITNCQDIPGGAANTALNLSRMGGTITLISVRGNDEAGRILEKRVQSENIQGLFASEKDRRTITKTRYSAEGQLIARFDGGGCRKLSTEAEEDIISFVKSEYGEQDTVILSDYAGDVISHSMMETLESLRARNPRILLIVDSRFRIPYFASLKPAAVKPSYEEACAFLKRGKPPGQERVEFIRNNGAEILSLSGASLAAVTLDRDGALIFEEGVAGSFRTYTRQVINPRSAGAGDAYLSALALSLNAGADGPDAALIAGTAASVVLSKDGTSSCFLEELNAALDEDLKILSSPDEAAVRAQLYRNQGKRVVLTNGYFDTLHSGSTATLNRAKELGDVLIVGLNSDDSIRRVKGAGQPIHTLTDRIHVLAALSCVDHVVPFDSDTACGLLDAVHPDIYAKGGNHSQDDLPEVPVARGLGIDVVILPYVGDISTSRIIERIQHADPAGQQPEEHSVERHQ